MTGPFETVLSDIGKIRASRAELEDQLRHLEEEEERKLHALKAIVDNTQADTLSPEIQEALREAERLSKVPRVTVQHGGGSSEPGGVAFVGELGRRTCERI